MDLSHLGLELGGYNNELAALQSDHYTEVPHILHTMYMCTNSRYAHDTWHWSSSLLFGEKQSSLKLPQLPHFNHRRSTSVHGV